MPPIRRWLFLAVVLPVCILIPVRFGFAALIAGATSFAFVPPLVSLVAYSVIVQFASRDRGQRGYLARALAGSVAAAGLWLVAGAAVGA